MARLLQLSVLLLFIATLCVPEAALAKGPPAKPLLLTGHAGGSSQHDYVAVVAQWGPSGGADGFLTVGPAMGGQVTQVVPPSGDSNQWCVTAQSDSQNATNILLFVRDSGDGRKTFDQWAALQSSGTCADQTAAPSWLTTDPNDGCPGGRGDFQSTQGAERAHAALVELYRKQLKAASTTIAPACSAETQQATMITGFIRGGRGGSQLAMVAQSRDDGVVDGRVAICPRGCWGGPVFQVTPPNGPNSWCVAVHDTEQDYAAGTVVFYFDDSGDGRKSYDRWGACSCASRDCTTQPSSSVWLYPSGLMSLDPALGGNFGRGDFQVKRTVARSHEALMTIYREQVRLSLLPKTVAG